MLACFVGCANQKMRSASKAEESWKAKATTLPSSSYNRQDDSLLLLNYWLAFKKEVMEAQLDQIARKLPLDPAQKCMPLDSTFTEDDKYWAYQTILAGWLEGAQAQGGEALHFTLGDRQNSMLVVTNSYQVDVRPHVVSENELTVYLVRSKNKLGITGAACENYLTTKKASR
jgi:hypothetical protein